MNRIDYDTYRKYGIIVANDHPLYEPVEPSVPDRDEDSTETSDIDYHGQHERFTS